MKFARASAFVLALPLLAAANGTPPVDQCNTGNSLMCCDSTQSASTASKSLLGLLGLLGVVVGDLTGLIGVTCSPITVIGAGGTSCSEQPVCCSGNSFSGIVATGCSPVNINL